MAKIIGLVLVTLIAAALGGFGGRSIYQLASAAVEHDKKAQPEHVAEKPKAKNIRELKPMVTNLASPSSMWVRLEAAIVTDDSGADVDKLAGDIRSISSPPPSCLLRRRPSTSALSFRPAAAR